MINTHTLIPLKRGTNCLIIKLKIGPNCLGRSCQGPIFMWAELVFGPSCPAPFPVMNHMEQSEVSYSVKTYISEVQY